MKVLFFIAAGVAVIATGMTITRSKAIHALLYLVVSFLALALVFWVVGAPFIAALEVIIYAGAIMVLFLFALMLIDPGRRDELRERQWMRAPVWIIPSALCAVLLFEVVYLLAVGGVPGAGGTAGRPGPGGSTGAGPAAVGGAAASASDAAAQVKAVGLALFGPYLLGVELASILLLAGLVAAHRLTGDAGRRDEARGSGDGDRSGAKAPPEGRLPPAPGGRT